MNEALKWGLILGGGYLAYNWFQNSQPHTLGPTDNAVQLPTPMTPTQLAAQKAADACVAAGAIVSDVLKGGAWDVNNGPSLEEFRRRVGIDNPTCSLPVLKNVPAPNLLNDASILNKIAVTNPPPGFSYQSFGMSGVWNYVRRGSPMRTR